MKARNLIISTQQAEPHRVVESQLGDARNHGFDKYGLLPGMLEQTVKVPIHSLGGSYLGSVAALNLGNPIMDAFLHRMARSLYHSVKKSGFLSSKIRWRTNLQADDYSIFSSGTTLTVGDVFSFTAIFSEESQDSLWLLTFYERLRFIVKLEVTMA